MKVPRRTLLKRRSLRHVSEATAIASEYGNSAKIIVPRSWLGKRKLNNNKRREIKIECWDYKSSFPLTYTNIIDIAMQKTEKALSTC